MKTPTILIALPVTAIMMHSGTTSKEDCNKEKTLLSATGLLMRSIIV